MAENRNKSFIKLLWSYVIVIIIPVIVLGILTVGVLFSQLAEDTKNLNISILEQSKNIVDTDMSSVHTLFYQVMKNERINDFSANQYNEVSIKSYEAWRVVNEISLIQANNRMFESVGIYIKKNNIVLDKSTAHTLQEYYNKYLNGSSYDYEQFEEMINSEKSYPFFWATQAYKNDTLRDKLICFQILDRVDKAESGMFIAIIDSNAIISKIKSVGADNNFCFAVIDNEGNVLLKTDNSYYDIDINRMYHRSGEYKNNHNSVFYRSSEVVDLKYIYFFPKSGLKGNVGYVTWIFLLLFFIAIAISIVLAVINTKRINKPILAMFDENRNLTENLREQVLADLLHNVQTDETEQAQLFSKYHISFDMEKICVIVVGFPEPGDLGFNVYSDTINAAWRAINSIISSRMDNLCIKYYAVRTNTSNSVYILNYKNTEILEVTLEEILQVFKDDHNISLNIGVGDSVLKTKEISRSYDGAVFALRYAAREKNGNIVHYKDIQGLENNKIYYTNEKEYLLIRNIKTGTKENTAEILNEIYNINFHERQLSQGTLRRLIFDISLVIYKILDDVYTEDNEKFEKYSRVCQNILRKDDIEECFEILKGICLSLCEDIKDHNNSDNIKRKIMAYISEHYTNKDLSLDMLAEHIDMNYHYLSRMFKEYMGANFIPYITAFRLEKAKELLENSFDTVEQIAEKTGFSGSPTFIRTFKKYYSTTPGKYKKQP